MDGLFAETKKSTAVYEGRRARVSTAMRVV